MSMMSKMGYPWRYLRWCLRSSSILERSRWECLAGRSRELTFTSYSIPVRSMFSYSDSRICRTTKIHIYWDAVR